MKIPKEIKIKTKIYTIEYDKESLRDDNRYGVCYHAKQKIILDPTQKRDQLEISFLHELLHAIIDSSSLRKEFAQGQEEKVVSGLAEDLLLVIKENKLNFNNK